MPFEIHSSILIKKETDLSPAELNTINNAKIPTRGAVFLIDKNGKIPVTVLTGNSAIYFDELLSKYETNCLQSENKFLESLPENLKEIHRKLLAKRIVTKRGAVRHSFERGREYSIKYDIWREGKFFYKRILDDKLSCRLKNEANSLKYIQENSLAISPGFISYDPTAGTLCCEYIEGLTLPSLFKESLQDRYKISEKIISCYKKLHAVNMFHGDVSMNNIIVDSSGEVFLVDFEWARLDCKIEGLDIKVTREENPVATLFYCPPDVANAWLKKKTLKKTFQSELYSVASLIYHLLLKTPLVDPLEYLIKNEYLNNIISSPSISNLDQLEQLKNKEIANWIRVNLTHKLS
ncbi:protein kinase domain-containing protein [Chromobacterium subtsugae]|uniref:protein kinase domain-containing protein n=1 Tax=Chromobacterium subtsugae TaxID=251747 RepID=UPI0009C0DBBC|nr:RIO1 family regulatory kinase/ATPase [Chromobacterium subtsugae]